MKLNELIVLIMIGSLVVDILFSIVLTDYKKPSRVALWVQNIVLVLSITLTLCLALGQLFKWY